MIVRLQQLLRRKFVQDTLVLQIGSAIRVGVNFVSSVLIARLMGPSSYGEWALTASFFAIWQSLNLTGVGPSTLTRLSAAVGGRDEQEALNLLAFYIRVMLLWALPCILLMTVVGIPLASWLYTREVTLFGGAVISQPDAQVGVMAALYAWVLIPDGFYNMVVVALQSRRAMSMVALLLDVNAVILGVCVVGALLISPTLPGMVVGRLIYSLLSMLVGLWLYGREREQGTFSYPSLRAILAHSRRVALRPYWRFGVVIALDRNAANLFIQVPVQLVGIFTGVESAGYLQLALRAVQLPNNLTSAIFDNMQAVVPQAVGRGDYARLWRNFNRVLLALTGGASAFYLLAAALVLLFGHIIVPLLYGDDWLPALPLLAVIMVFGAVTTVGGVFGPLYRALELVRGAMLLKLLVLAVGLLPGIWLVMEAGALGGAWLINALFAASVLLTAVLTLPVLRQRKDIKPQTHEVPEGG